jgi:hypothetical protein
MLPTKFIVSGSCALPPRWPPQCSCVVIESSFDPGERLQANFGRGPSNDYFIKVWFQFELLVPEKKIFM